jgi:hypothetical protein
MPDNNARSNDDRGAVRFENDRVHVFNRDGVYQARIRIASNKYLYRTLKTFNRAQAIQAAQKLLHTIEFKQDAGLPVTSRSFNSVIDEYVQFRTKQHAQGHTSIHMLRQIESRAQILAASVTPKIHWIMPFDLKQRARPSH